MYVIIFNFDIVCVMPTDCKAWKELGIKQSGVYPIKPDNGAAFQVIYSTSLMIYFHFILTGLL